MAVTIPANADFGCQQFRILHVPFIVNFNSYRFSPFEILRTEIRMCRFFFLTWNIMFFYDTKQHIYTTNSSIENVPKQKYRHFKLQISPIKTSGIPYITRGREWVRTIVGIGGRDGEETDGRNERFEVVSVARVIAVPF